MRAVLVRLCRASCLLAWMASPSAFAAPETPEAFGQRVAVAIAGHPDVIAARRALAAAELGVDAAMAGYYPRVTLGGDVGRDTTVNGTGTGTDSVSRQAIDLNVRQNLYTGGRLTAQVGAAKVEQQQLQVALQQTRQRIAQDALSGHLQVARANLLVSLATASERATQALLDLEKRRVSIGGGTRADTDFARTRLSLARERTAQYQVQLDEAINGYRLVFREEPRIDE